MFFFFMSDQVLLFSSCSSSFAPIVFMLGLVFPYTRCFTFEHFPSGSGI
jgi:hypothetical protein